MAKRRPITPETPLGNNKLSSQTMFDERTLYRDSVSEFQRTPTMDLLYKKYESGWFAPGKILYGRVDPKGYPVYLAEENLKQILSKDRKTHFVLNFVADAFHDFQRYWRKTVKRHPGFDASPGPLVDMEVFGAWASVHKTFHSLYSGYYDMFTSHKKFLSTTRDAKIVDFEGFLGVFREFVSVMAPDLPMTRSGYIASRFTAPELSGMVVNLIKEPRHGEDFAKWVGYFHDSNYEMYAAAALRFGFVVDINAPWRLVADISSPPMSNYLKKYGVGSLKQAFEEYYIPAYKYDIDVLKHYMRNIYNSYIVASPNVKVKVPSDCESGKTVWRLTKRKPLSVSEFEHKYPPRYWIRLYAWLRAKETAQAWSQTEFEAVVRKAKKYEKILNIETALKYINSKCVDYRSELHGYPTLSKDEVGEIMIEKSTKVTHGTFNF